MLRVILPQALVEMVPPFNNLFIQLLKSSSLLTIITVHEMTYQAREVLIDRFISQAAVIWTIVLLFYLALAVLITTGMRRLERWAASAGGPADAADDAAHVPSFRRISGRRPR